MKRTKRMLARTAKAFAPDCDKSWLRVTLKDGSVVRIQVICTRGLNNSVAILEVDAPKGSRIEPGEQLGEPSR